MRRMWASMVLAGVVLASLPASAGAASPNIIQVGPGGWSGGTQTTDSVNGWGRDAWAVTVGGTTPATITVTVTDCCLVGDNFVVYVDGRAIGTTPAVAYGGPTPSSGTFTTTVPRNRNAHLVTIRDVGGVFYQQQGHAMFPAGYSVTITSHG